jgi:hypothetical protein
MTNTNISIDELSGKIEKMVAEHVAAVRIAAQAAVARAFAAMAPHEAPVVAKRARATEVRQSRPRRPASELAALGERFYRAVREKPGETMLVLSGEIGVSARDLYRAVAELRRTDRVRVVAERSHTRYFPMASEAASAA